MFRMQGLGTAFVSPFLRANICKGYSEYYEFAGPMCRIESIRSYGRIMVVSSG